MEANTILKQARLWIGLRENNGGHKTIIDTYNAHKPLARGYKVKYTDDWCATFVSAVAIKCGATDIIPTECSCGRMIQLMQNKGIWIEDESKTPQPGDILMYDWDDKGKGDNKGWPEHVGYVDSVKDGQVYVIEGNYNNGVGIRPVPLNGRYLRGYGRPKYQAEPVKPAAPAAPTLTLEEVVKKTKNGDYGNGAERKRRIPAETPYTYEEVQAVINGTTAAKKPAQTAPAVAYYPKYTGSSKSIVTALKTLKIDSSKAYREKIAKANGLRVTKDMAEANEKMLVLLKQGKLKKA